jgi:hypothetical protein
MLRDHMPGMENGSTAVAISPLGVRTATATALGPTIMTPFRSALPPYRGVSCTSLIHILLSTADL